MGQPTEDFPDYMTFSNTWQILPIQLYIWNPKLGFSNENTNPIGAIFNMYFHIVSYDWNLPWTTRSHLKSEWAIASYFHIDLPRRQLLTGFETSPWHLSVRDLYLWMTVCKINCVVISNQVCCWRLGIVFLENLGLPLIAVKHV